MAIYDFHLINKKAKKPITNRKCVRVCDCTTVRLLLFFSLSDCTNVTEVEFNLSFFLRFLLFRLKFFFSSVSCVCVSALGECKFYSSRFPVYVSRSNASQSHLRIHASLMHKENVTKCSTLDINPH